MRCKSLSSVGPNTGVCNTLHSLCGSRERDEIVMEVVVVVVMGVVMGVVMEEQNVCELRFLLKMTQLVQLWGARRSRMASLLRLT